VDNPFYFRRPNTWLHKITYFVYFWIKDIFSFWEIFRMEQKIKKENNSNWKIKELKSRREKTRIYKWVERHKRNIIELDPAFIFLLYIAISLFFVICIYALHFKTCNYLDPLVHSHPESIIHSISSIPNHTEKVLVFVIGTQESGNTIISEWLEKEQPSYPYQYFRVISINQYLDILCPSQTLNYTNNIITEINKMQEKSSELRIGIIMTVRDPIELLCSIFHAEYTKKHSEKFEQLVRNMLQNDYSISFYHHVLHILTKQIHIIKTCDQSHKNSFLCYTENVCFKREQNFSASYDYGMFLVMYDYILEEWIKEITRLGTDKAVFPNFTIVFPWNLIYDQPAHKIQTDLLIQMGAMDMTQHSFKRSLVKNRAKENVKVKEYLPLGIRKKLYPIFKYHMGRLTMFGKKMYLIKNQK